MNYDGEGKKSLENERKHISDWTNTSVFAFESSDCLLIHQTTSFSSSSPHNSPSKTDPLPPSDWHTNLCFIVFLILIRRSLTSESESALPAGHLGQSLPSFLVPLRIRSHSESGITWNQVSLRIRSHLESLWVLSCAFFGLLLKAVRWHTWHLQCLSAWPIQDSPNPSLLPFVSFTASWSGLCQFATAPNYTLTPLIRVHHPHASIFNTAIHSSASNQNRIKRQFSFFIFHHFPVCCLKKGV